MHFKTNAVCVSCNGEVVVYPASKKMSRINERTLPGWEKCHCGFNEITRMQFDTMVPGWEKLINPKEDIDSNNDVQSPNEVIE